MRARLGCPPGTRLARDSLVPREGCGLTCVMKLSTPIPPASPAFVPAQPPIGRALPALLLLLTVFGPISMDLYLPALPALTAELNAATSVAQLTVTACLIGLAAGQLVAGPLSDRLGRRGVLLVGIVAYVATSALCALAPTIEVLILARFVQGLA